MDAGSGIVGWVSKNGKAIRAGNVKGVEFYVERDARVRSELCVPLRIGGHTIGCINVESFEANAFSANDERLLTTVAGQAAISIETARLFEETRTSQEALTRSEGELRALFHAMTDVIIVYNHEGRYMRIAPTNPSRLVKPSEELLGKLVHDVLPKEKADQFVEAIQQTLDGECRQLEYDLR